MSEIFGVGPATSMDVSIEKTKRDLRWAMSSPSLLASTGNLEVVPKTEQHEIDQVFSIAKLDQKLADHFSKLKSHFLGAYYEHLWLFNLIHNKRYELVTSNHQVISGGKTLGEFDFIVYDHLQNSHIHQELAVKFYLGHQNEDQRGYWIGPQTVDRLDLKVEKLRLHQTKLGQTDLGQHALKSMGVTNIKSQVMVQGILFYPGQGLTPENPEYVNPGHNRGQWLAFESFTDTLTSKTTKAYHWTILDKLDWLETDYDSLAQRSVTSDELSSQLTNLVIMDNRPKLLARLAETNENKSVDKVFVTPDTWPKLNG